MKLLNKKSFTLLEIVIVLLMMGLVYTLSITSFSKLTIEDSNTYFSLKRLLKEKITLEQNQHTQLIVLDDEAIIRINNDKSTDKKIKLPKDIKFYSYWQDDTEREDFAPYYEDEYFKDVIFRYIIYPNGTSTKCIVEYKDKFYIQSNYFKNDKVFNDIFEAKDYLLESNIKNSLVLIDE